MRAGYWGLLRAIFRAHMRKIILSEGADTISLITSANRQPHRSQFVMPLNRSRDVIANLDVSST